MKRGLLLLACLLVALLLLTLVQVDVTATGRTVRLLSWANSVEANILWQWRLPRALTALLVGGALAAAGVALQALLRNPLAEPFTLGISSTSSLAAVIAIRLGFATGWMVHGAALIGALAAVWIVWRLARLPAGIPTTTLLLAGIALSTWAAAASMLVQHTASFLEVAAMVRWMMGSLRDISGYGGLVGAGPVILVALVALQGLARSLNALALGPDGAAAVGVNVPRVQRTVFGLASLLVGLSIALAGPIGFVGLMVPHLVRGLVGPDHSRLLPWSVAVGATALAVCDALARIILAPDQLAVGIVTALAGGPFFVALLVRDKRRHGLWLSP